MFSQPQTALFHPHPSDPLCNCHRTHQNPLFTTSHTHPPKIQQSELRTPHSMEDFRSKSYSDGGTQMERHSHDGPRPDPNGFHDLRCYSASYASSSQTQMEMGAKDVKFKKGKSSNGSGSKNWSLSDPELQRRKRVASYKAYAVEGNVKGSIRKSFRWLKDRYNLVVYGWR